MGPVVHPSPAAASSTPCGGPRPARPPSKPPSKGAGAISVRGDSDRAEAVAVLADSLRRADAVLTFPRSLRVRRAGGPKKGGDVFRRFGPWMRVISARKNIETPSCLRCTTRCLPGLRGVHNANGSVREGKGKALSPSLAEAAEEARYEVCRGVPEHHLVRHLQPRGLRQFLRAPAGAERIYFRC